MISRHNRVGTLFFATAEFIFDDWHRFLGVVVGDRKTQEGGKLFLLLYYHSFAMDVMALQMVVVCPDHRHHSHRLMVSPELGQELVGFQSENRYCD